MNIKIKTMMSILLCLGPLAHAEISGSGIRVDDCEAEIGDRVWHDLDGNGLQDTGEPGLEGVRVRLEHDGGSVEVVSGVDGFFSFYGVCPGTYMISIDADSLPTGMGPTLTDSASDALGEALDSDGPSNGSPLQVIVTDTGEKAGQIDFGYQLCHLSLDQTCLVIPPLPEECTDKIAATRLRYIGPLMEGAEVQLKGKDRGDVTYSTIDLVPGVTVLTGQDGFSIDARPEDLGSELKVYINGVEEKLHTSCSTAYLIGLPAPLHSPKGDPSPNWLVEAYVDKDGRAAALSDATPANECVLQAPERIACTERPVRMSFRYTGEDCSRSRNTQEPDKWFCTDFASPDGPVQITLYKSDKVFGSGVALMPGKTLEASAALAGRDELESDLYAHIFGESGSLLQTVRLHTSCSQDLRAGDRFGALEVLAYENPEQGLVQAGADVSFGYAVRNDATSSATDLAVFDAALGPINALPALTLLPASRADFANVQMISETAIHSASASASIAGAACQATDSVSVTVTPRPAQLDCNEPIKSLSLRWNGSESVRVVAHDGDIDKAVLYDIESVQVGETLAIGLAGSPKDVVWEVYSAESGDYLGASTFHLSCSDASLDGPEDCGTAQGDGKDGGASRCGGECITDWLLEGMIDKDEAMTCD